jgi:hypothetical protein
MVRYDADIEGAKQNLEQTADIEEPARAETEDSKIAANSEMPENEGKADRK